MTEDKARELAKRFGVRMCDENGNTHDEELYCLGLDDIIEMAKDLAQTGQSDLDAICQDLQEKTYNQAMRIAALEAQLAQPEQENKAFNDGVLEGVMRERAYWTQEQPKQEPMAFVHPVPDHCDRIVWRNSYYHLPITPQRTWVDLTDEEVLGLFGKFTSMTGKSWLDLYRMTEAKRKEKTHELDA